MAFLKLRGKYFSDTLFGSLILYRILAIDEKFDNHFFSILLINFYFGSSYLTKVNSILSTKYCLETFFYKLTKNVNIVYE